MKKITLISLFTLSLTMLFGVEPSSLLDDMTKSIEALGRYDVTFRLKVNETPMDGVGSYRVDGDRYSLEIAGQSILGEGSARYTIDHAAREVVIEPLVGGDDALPLIVLDPSKAFVSLGRHFDAEMRSVDSRTLTLKLTPKSKRESMMISGSLLRIDRVTNLPRSLIYEADGESIELEILSMTESTEGVAIEYPLDYDVIDIR